jgi:hypothetical protein
MKQPFPLLLLLLAAAGCLAKAASLEDLIQKGDRLDAQFKSVDAMAVFLEAEKLAPNNIDVLCRLAKTHDEAMVDTADRQEQRKLAQTAVDYARRAVELAPKSAKAHLSVAITCGRLAPFLENREKIRYSKLVKEHAEKALSLEPSNSYAHHILGAWNYEMALISPILRAIAKLVYGGLPAASLQQAEIFFSRAVTLDPNKVSHRIELGRTYAALRKRELAREEISKGLSLPDREKDDPNTKLRGLATLANL